MKNEELFQILGGIDSKFIEKASEDLAFWQESQKGIRVRIDNSIKFSWKTVIASAACTAAVLIGVFVLLLNIGKIGIIDSPASSGAEISNSSESPSIVLPESPSDTVLFEEAAYAYEVNDLNNLKRYEVGDRFGEYSEILTAKTTYKISDGTSVIQKQEITVRGRFVFQLEKNSYKTDGSTYIGIQAGRTNELGLPIFAGNFHIEPIYFPMTDENTHGEGSTVRVTLLNMIITVDYEAESITIEPQSVSLHFTENF